MFIRFEFQVGKIQKPNLFCNRIFHQILQRLVKKKLDWLNVCTVTNKGTWEM